MKTLIVTLLSLIAVSAAAIPDYHMIMSRAAENHGRGIYMIEQDVVFRGDPDPLVVKETWWIAGENAMRVTFEGRGSLKGLIHGAIVYEDNQKHWREEGGALKTARLGDEWFEPFWHFRFSKNIKPKLVSLKIAPPESLKPRAISVKDGTEFTYAPQNFMRLARTGGTVSYAIGTPSDPESATGAPGLWIEQDQFVVQKIRLPTNVLIRGEQFNKYSEDFWLPRTRTVAWGPNAVQLHVGNVRSMKKAKSASNMLLIKSLDVQKNPSLVVRWPEQDLIREFYQRFR